MTIILTILFMLFMWSLCRISKKQEPGLENMEAKGVADNSMNEFS